MRTNDNRNQISRNESNWNRLLKLGLLAALSCEGPAGPPGPPGESAELPPDLTPFQKLEAGLGGREALDALTGLQIEGEGARYIPFEGYEPDQEPTLANDFTRTVSIDVDDDFIRVDTERSIRFLFIRDETYSDFVRGNLGASTEPFFGMPLGNMSSDKVAAIRKQELLLNPHVLVKGLGASDVTPAGDVFYAGSVHHRLNVETDVGELSLYVDSRAGHLAKLVTSEADFYRGDVALEVHFSGWHSLEGGLDVPDSVYVVRGSNLLFSQTIETVQINPEFPADHFNFPDGADPEFNQELFDRGERSHQWYYLLDSIGLPFSGIDNVVTPVEVADGVEQLQGASHHSFVVEQASGLVLVDAPLYAARGKALVDHLAEAYPGKPITHVVSSHFHEDHAAGIREVLGLTDAALVVHDSVEGFWREVLQARVTLAPDALSENRRSVTIITVPDNGSLALADATHPVTIYDMNSEHSTDLLLIHEESSNAVFVVDIYSPGFADQFFPADLNDAIVDNDIPTADLQIVGGHGGELHDYDELLGFID